MYELLVMAALPVIVSTNQADVTEVQRFRGPAPRFRDPRPYREPRFRGEFSFRFGPRYPRYVPRYYDPYYDPYDPYWRWRWRRPWR